MEGRGMDQWWQEREGDRKEEGKRGKEDAIPSFQIHWLHTCVLWLSDYTD